MIFLSPFLDVVRMSNSRVPFIEQLDSGTHDFEVFSFDLRSIEV